ncbi:MAG: CehA/McbA family metallohydrolase, partial [Thermoleophilaceae bacterium]|nr:CehA/McbA family metallohydrolase [Thermoleophilaceae bacterium]
MRRALAAAGLALALLPAAAGAAAPARCAGAGEFKPTKSITGEFSPAQQGAYVMVPFEVPAGTTQVRLRYCYDQPDTPLSARLGHTLDLGLYEPRRSGRGAFGKDEFRGWGGSSHPEVQITPQGFSSEAEYKRAPKANVPGRTTRGYLPGPIPAGEWAAELGVAAVIPREQGDLDGKVAWRVEVELSDDPAYAREPYAPASYDQTPARSGPGWYTGDLHVHAEHSALGDATMTEVFDYAFKSRGNGGAGLDFISLSDYVTNSGWGEIGRHQGRYPGKLIERSIEVITYAGHLMNHGSAEFVDYRTGPVLERGADGKLTLMRGAQAASRVLGDIRAAGGWTQINHPTIFPSAVPTFATFCRGCPWDYSADATDYSRVDAIEVATGPSGLQQVPGNPAPNPFNSLAIGFWGEAIGRGHVISPVGVSDSHHAGRTNDPLLQSPVGTAASVVYAPELSEKGIQCAAIRGRTYAKVTGSGGPDIRFEARREGRAEPAIMGDALASEAATFTVRVMGATSSPTLLVVKHNGAIAQVAPVTGEDFSHVFRGQGRGTWHAELQRGLTTDTVTGAIRLAGPGADETLKPCPAPKVAAVPPRRLSLTVKPRRIRA